MYAKDKLDHVLFRWTSGLYGEGAQQEDAQGRERAYLCRFREDAIAGG